MNINKKTLTNYLQYISEGSQIYASIRKALEACIHTVQYPYNPQAYATVLLELWLFGQLHINYSVSTFFHGERRNTRKYSLVCLKWSRRYNGPRLFMIK